MATKGRDGDSHWLAGAHRGGDERWLSLPAETEIAVVGGGAIGVSIAYWLAVAGVQPLLLEASEVASGASGRNGGLVLFGRSPLEKPEILRSVLELECVDADYAEPGHLALAGSDTLLDEFRDEVARRPPGADRLEVLDRSQCEDLLGLAIARRIRGGRWLPDGALVDPLKLVRSLAAAARRRGAVLASGTRVLRVAGEGDRVHLRTVRGSVRARRVVLACGVQTAAIAGAPGLLTPSRGQMLSTVPAPLLFRIGLALDFGTVYWRQAPDGAIVLGGLRSVDPASEATDKVCVNRRIQAALERFLPETFPGLQPIPVAHRWAGIMDETTDGRPLAGPWRDHRVWLAAGFGGHGLPPALGVGRAIARGLVAGCLPCELDRLAPDRFAAKVAA
jgi:glycine/D-amino acid oxidase-like deaminating enzyme